MPGTNHCSAEPSRRRAAAARRAPRNTSGCTIANSTEAGSRQHRPELADHHVPGVGEEAGEAARPGGVRRAAGAGLDGRGAHAAAPSWSVLVGRSRSLSRRLRPVRSRKTSSRVGPTTSTGRPARPAAARSVTSPAARSRPCATRIETSVAVEVDDCAPSIRDARAAPRRRPSVVGEAERDQVAERRLQPGRGVVGDHRAVVDHDHPPGERVGLLEVVGGQHDRGALLLVQPPDLLLEVDPVLRVEAGRRLVEEQQPRGVHQPDRDVEPAPLAAGQGRHRAAGVLGQVERVEQLLGATRAPRPATGRRRGPG